MKALVLEQYLHLQVADVPLPAVGPDEVRIEVAACGICGSDVHGYDGSTGRRIPPIVMGHEAAGIVSAVGKDVRRFQAGDRVTFDSTVYCGQCEFCSRGEINLCSNRQVVGVSCPEFKRPGAFAEQIAVPERIVYKLPDAMSFAEAAMLEAVSVAEHAVQLSHVQAGDTALVVGAGMIGLLALQCARAAGCSRVFVTDVDPTRLSLATRLGGEAILSNIPETLAAAILEKTAGRGVDLVLEAVGRNETVAASVGAVRKGGTVTLIGNVTPEVTLPLQQVVTRQIRLQGSCASSGEYPQAMQLVAAGKVQLAPLITAVASLYEGADWFARLHAREPNLMKVVLDPRLPEGSA